MVRAILYVTCEQYGLKPVHYSITVPPVMENERCKVLWDQSIQTQAVLKHNKPDIVVFDKEASRIVIIEVSIARTAGIKMQRELKINRYTVNSTEVEDETQIPYSLGANLLGEIEKIFRQTVEFLPIVIGTCGEHSTDTYGDLRRVLRLRKWKIEHLMERMSRAAVIGTSRVVRAHLAKV